MKLEMDDVMWVFHFMLCWGFERFFYIYMYFSSLFFVAVEEDE